MTKNGKDQTKRGNMVERPFDKASRVIFERAQWLKREASRRRMDVDLEANKLVPRPSPHEREAKARLGDKKAYWRDQHDQADNAPESEEQAYA